ncbi:hypothetical protein [Chromatium okenii]|uniref:hypothetical protein n=1 Tax=Chromatium okenii TaxID=61644 RepID=UPI001A9350CF|nr:hypothetical protein [Chromatium okenii]
MRSRVYHNWHLALFLSVIHLAALTHPAPAAANSIPAPFLQTLPIPAWLPAPLQPWLPWVLATDGQDRRHCPLDLRSGERRCAWAGRLELDLDSNGGHFAQTWTVLATTWIALPGDAALWPQTVRDGDQPLPVLPHAGHPAVRLDAGEHRLTGQFQWATATLPDALPVPAATGLFTLRRNGQLQPQPRLEPDGRLWLRDPTAAPADAAGDWLRVTVLRRIEDELPLQMRTRLELTVGGRAREIQLGPVPIGDGVPFDLNSPLPARLEPDGMLRVQVRPGQWTLEVATAHPDLNVPLTLTPRPAPWPAVEIWAFAARPDLRQVTVSGAPALDPQQTQLPAEWSALPVYRLGAGDTLRLDEQRRGDPTPDPDRLQLNRELWLDFTGSGYSVQDRISGQLTRTWRLEADARLQLGQVQIAGQAVPINRLGDGAAAGVEVRRGLVNVSADGRLELPINQLPASGWALRFDSAQTTLHLPPGWDVLAISGVDNVPNTWLTRWTLLDLFLLLIVVIGAARLWGASWGAVALLALVLTWQAPDAPQQVWLHLLAATALRRAVLTAAFGGRWVQQVVTGYWRGSVLALLLIGLSFVITQVRTGIYPQLTHPAALARAGDGFGNAEVQFAPQVSGLTEDAVDALPAAPIAREMLSSTARRKSASPASAPPQPLEVIDPQAQIQTGVGVPTWHWQQVTLAWSGPVGATEAAQLWLLTPPLQLGVALLGSLLMGLLGWRLSGWQLPQPTAAGMKTALVLMAALTGGLHSEPTLAEELPSPKLLQELRERLLAPPDCVPHCVELARLAVRADATVLTLELTLDAATAVAAPVPGGSGAWSPQQVEVDGAALELMQRDAAGQLVVPLAAGQHQVILRGAIPAAAQLDVPLPLAPHLVMVDVDGWRVAGLEAETTVTQLQLVRLATADAAPLATLTQEALPPLLRVERRLRFGVEWQVETRVLRLSAPEFAVLLPITLLPSEAVQTAGVAVVDGQVLAALPPGVTELTWTARLDPVSALTLTASADPRLSELWTLDLSTLWHLTWHGLAPVYQREPLAQWLPQWRPRAGEQLTLELTRPLGVPGATLTFDRVAAQIAPGQRGSTVTLTLALRSSRGGNHLLPLPAGVEPLRIALDGRVLPVPIAAADGTIAVELPLVPGSQQVTLTWRDPQPLGFHLTPRLPDVGQPAVNLNVRVQMPTDRWILLTTGPLLGPAVLVWGVLLVVTGMALALGRSRLTPLRTRDWLLLGVGLSVAQVWANLLIVGWLFALGAHQRQRQLHTVPAGWRLWLLHTGLAGLTLAALIALLIAIQQGLLGYPDMHIAGNDSTAHVLNWYQDRTDNALPKVEIYSLPLWVYRALMLAWALWLAVRLLNWLRWGWNAIAAPIKHEQVSDALAH